MTELRPGLNEIPPSSVVADYNALLAAREGFAASVTGAHGSKSRVYLVTDNADDGPNTLRDALRHSNAHIIFEQDSVINLQSTIVTEAHNVTIDGRSNDIKVTGAGIRGDGADNIIITGFRIVDGNGNDALSFLHTPLFWVHHMTLEAFPDGLLDVIAADEKGMKGTVSWCRFSRHVKTCIAGGHNPPHEWDRKIRMTFSHNYFEGTEHRHPNAGQGVVHCYNNVIDFDKTGSTVMSQGRLLAQNNVYSSPEKRLPRYAIRSRVEKTHGHTGEVIPFGFARSVGNWLKQDNLIVEENEPQKVADMHYMDDEWRESCLDQADLALEERVKQSAGAL